MDLSLPQLISVAILPLILAITMRESAHAWVAKWCGDKTAYLMGKATLNPLIHIDWIGTVAVPLFSIVLAAMGGLPPFVFGWAKPVPIDFRNLRSRRRDQALVALSGPVANLIMACLWGLIVRLGLHLGGEASLAAFLQLIGGYGIMINVVLAALHLLPLPPLDGATILAAVLPRDLAIAYNRLAPYGFWLALLLMVTGILQRIVFPLATLLRSLVHAVVGV